MNPPRLPRGHLTLLGATVAVGALLFLFAVAPASRAAAQEIQRVLVTNFPEIFTVRGAVRVEDPVPATRLLSREDVLVSPVGRDEAVHWVDAGLLRAEGFSHAVISLRGEVRSQGFRPGDVGLVLLPDDEGVQEAFERYGVAQLGLSVEAAARLEDRGQFAGSSQRVALAFPVYRAFLYNTTDKPVAADLHLYLSQ